MEPVVSVIIPVYNEEKYLSECIDSLLVQDYPKEQMEWLFVDGNSTDRTREILSSFSEKYPDLIKVLSNVKKIAPAAMNIGINDAKGKYIIRLDAHASYSSDYISKCVYYLENTDADNVGGVATTKAKNFMGNCIAKMLSSRFGVGDSQFRIAGNSGYVDTVPFGAFRKEVFEKVGLFDESLIRSEDNDLNSRIRKAGGRIWLSDEIKFTYFCRDTVKGILKMALLNGNALFPTIRKNSGGMRLRHYIPLFFFLFVCLFPLFSLFFKPLLYIYFSILILYFALDFFFSFCVPKIRYGFVTFWLFPLFHLVYGLGSFISFFGIVLY